MVCFLVFNVQDGGGNIWIWSLYSLLDESWFLRIGSAARLLGLCLSEATDVSLSLALIDQLLVDSWDLSIDLSD